MSTFDYQILMNRSLKSRLLLNLKILVWALFIAFTIFYIVRNPSLFQASVLSLQEIQIIQDQWRDIAYKNQTGLLDIFLSSGVQSPTSLDFSLVFDPDTEIQTQNLSWQWQISITNIWSWFADFHVTNLQNIDYTQSVLLISFTGKNANNYLIISEAKSLLSNWEKKDLSIWNLWEKLSHGK